MPQINCKSEQVLYLRYPYDRELREEQRHVAPVATVAQVTFYHMLGGWAIFYTRRFGSARPDQASKWRA
jgi:hypothetical protein